MSAADDARAALIQAAICQEGDLDGEAIQALRDLIDDLERSEPLPDSLQGRLLSLERQVQTLSQDVNLAKLKKR